VPAEYRRGLGTRNSLTRVDTYLLMSDGEYEQALERVAQLEPENCGLCGIIAWPVASGVNWSAVPTDIDEFLLRISDTEWVSHASGVLGMWIALWWCYFLVGWGLFGGTPGNWLTRTRVVDLKGRYPMGLSRAAMRLAGYIVNAVTLGLGHLLMFKTDRKALHDMLAGTRVVCRRPCPIPVAEPLEEGPESSANGDDGNSEVDPDEED
jgi:uncharacterized RDD family membrane protein YckC